MSDNLTTPFPPGTVLATKDLGSAQLPKTAIVDQSGVDATGEVAASPTANTILGRLKAIVTELASGAISTALTALSAKLPASLGAKVGTGSLSVVPSTDGFAVTTDAASSASAFPIVPSDATVIATRAVYVGGAGDVIATIGGTDVTFKSVPTGQFLPIKATKIKAATSATFLVGLA
jgi:hypothetical protein